MPTVTDSKILIMSTHGLGQSELFVPLEKLREAGAKAPAPSNEKRRKRLIGVARK